MYIASIVERHDLGNNTYIYNPKKTLKGNYDHEKDVFIDAVGNEYHSLGEINTKYSYLDIISIKDLEEYFENTISLRQMVDAYAKNFENMLIIQMTDKDGITHVLKANKDVIFNSVISYGFGLPEEEEKYYDIEALNEAASDLILGISNGKYTNEQIERLREVFDLEDTEEITKEIRYMFGEEFSEASSRLVMEIITGKYGEKELIEMKEFLNFNKEALEDVINSISLFAESLRRDNEQLERKDKVRKEEERLLEKKLEKQKIEKKGKEDKKQEKIDIEKVFKNVTNTLIAQDGPAKRVIVEIARKEMDDRKKKEGILLTGPTGVGKTELMRLIAKYLDRPFIKIDATQLTSPGYVGKDLEEALWDLYVECGEDIEKTQQAIVFFDEVDKKGSTKKDDPSGKGVLNTLLPFIEGTTYDACLDTKTSHKRVKIDTSNMIVVLGGAFTDVYKNLLEKNTIGFVNDISSEPKYRKATTKDFIEYGKMTDEFMGRVTVIKLNDLGVDDIKRVMLESDESALKIQEKIFKDLGVKITFTDGFTTEIAKRAEKKKTGARGLNGVIDEATWEAFTEVYSNPGTYKEVILDENTVEDASNYQLIKKK